LISGLFISKFDSFSKRTISRSYKELEEHAYKDIQSNINNKVDYITPILVRAENLTRTFASTSVLPLISTIEERKSKSAFNEARDIVISLIKSCNIQYKMVKEKVKLGLYAAEYIFQNKGRIYQSTNFKTSWTCKNQYTGEVFDQEFPNFYVGLQPIEKIYSYEENFSYIVDDVQEMTGVNCSIFQIMNKNGDMLRIATNVRLDDGQRGIETYIPAVMPDGNPNKVIQALMKEGIYEGVAIEVNTQVFSIYKGIYNDSGKLIGAFYIGVPTFDPYLNQSIIETKNRLYGHTFVFNSSGDYTVHQDMKYIGGSFKNEIGSTFFQEITQKKIRDKNVIPVYQNKNKSNIYACSYFKQRDWNICVSGDLSFIYKDEKDRVLTLLKDEMVNVYALSSITIDGKSRAFVKKLQYIDIKGNVLGSFKNGTFQKNCGNVSHNNWFTSGLSLKDRQCLNSSVITPENSKNEEIRIICPAYHQKKVIGLVVIYFDWEMIRLMLNKKHNDKNGISFVLDKSGLIVSHPEYRISDKKYASDSEFGKLAQIAEDKIFQGETGNSRLQLDNKDYYIHYAPVEAMNNSFFLASAVLVDDFLKMANRIKSDSENEYNDFIKSILTSLFFWTIMSIVIGYFFSRSISKPVEKLVNYSTNVSHGDLSKTLKSENKDEIGFLLTAINNMVLTYRKIVIEIISYARLLSNSSEKLVDTASDLTTIFEQMTGNSSDVTATSINMSNAINDISLQIEDMNNNIKRIQKTTESMSENTQIVASAIEKMSVSMNEIGQYASQGTDLTMKAVERTYRTGDTMSQLSKAAEDIGGVTNLIKRLAYKTNLIAINASIEASAAGKAGIGFSVIAKTIQSFAEQSNDAAENIAKHISNVQEIVSRTIEDISGTSQIIRDIHSSSTNITSLVQEQITVADEIVSSASSAKNSANNVVMSISSLSQGSDTISLNATNIAKGSAGVSENVKNVSSASLFSLEKIKQISQSAVELEQFSNDLKEIVINLKTE